MKEQFLSGTLELMLKYHDEIYLDIVTLDLEIQHCFLGNYC